MTKELHEQNDSLWFYITLKWDNIKDFRIIKGQILLIFRRNTLTFGSLCPGLFLVSHSGAGRREFGTWEMRKLCSVLRQRESVCACV